MRASLKSFNPPEKPVYKLEGKGYEDCICVFLNYICDAAQHASMFHSFCLVIIDKTFRVNFTFSYLHAYEHMLPGLLAFPAV